MKTASILGSRASRHGACDHHGHGSRPTHEPAEQGGPWFAIDAPTALIVQGFQVHGLIIRKLTGFSSMVVALIAASSSDISGPPTLRTGISCANARRRSAPPPSSATTCSSTLPRWCQIGESPQPTVHRSSNRESTSRERGDRRRGGSLQQPLQVEQASRCHRRQRQCRRREIKSQAGLHRRAEHVAHPLQSDNRGSHRHGRAY